MWAAGLIGKIRARNLPFDPTRNPYQDIENRDERLELESLIALFWFLFFGYCFSLLRLGFEVSKYWVLGRGKQIASDYEA